MADYPSLVVPVSAHPFNIGKVGNTGPEGTSSVLLGPTGATGPTGDTGVSGPAGNPGATIIGITYTSTGPNAYHLIVQYAGGVTTDGGYYRGPTGQSIYHLEGQNVGQATGGSFFKQSKNGVLYLRSITGGGGVKVVPTNDGRIKISFTSLDSAQAHGQTGELVFFSQNSAGTTGLSGATLTQYYPGPTYAVKLTTKRYDEVSGRISPHTWECETNTFIYKINPMSLLSLDAARKNRSMGNHWVIKPMEDYKDKFGTPNDIEKPFIRIIDSSSTEGEYDEFEEAFGKFTSLGFTLIIENGDNSGERIIRSDCDQGLTPDVPADQMIDYQYTKTFPINWKFPYNTQPTLTNGIDIIQFISIGTEDFETNKNEWYGFYARGENGENPFYY